MYDSSPDANKMEKWYPYRNFHIICFCQTLHKNLKKAGFCSHSIQYFPEVLDDCSSGNEQSVFFWNRSEKISSRLLGILFSNSHISHLHIHKALDPKKKFIPPDDSIADSISYSSWYPEKSDMLAEMEKYAIYIAPRIKEGIGMSFLEAMAMGRCVIAPDSPTMNEYITHEVNGLLYSLQDPQPINLSQVTQTQQNARLFIKKGRMKWETQKSNILTWISSTVKIEKKSMLPRVMIRLFTRPIKMMKMLVLDRQHLD
ncbi:MAG: glycosyltransferase family 4 protein [Verrucomicrobiae bacterium]|nr:glycosyltransferase family 4 protein [Verrucomicrobiae bacterium]NNJ87540.1 glycosyltransferase family 4 protein [Akkermansiaceae bacterium]